MVVVSSLQTTLHSPACPHYPCCKASSSSLLYLRHLYGIPTRPRASTSNGVLLVRAYMEESNSLSGFAKKIIGSLPVIGLVARILSDEGGVGGDIIDFAEFRRRVGNNCSINDSRAFYEFQERHGRVFVAYNMNFRASCISKYCPSCYDTLSYTKLNIAAKYWLK